MFLLTVVEREVIEEEVATVIQQETLPRWRGLGPGKRFEAELLQLPLEPLLVRLGPCRRGGGASDEEKQEAPEYATDHRICCPENAFPTQPEGNIPLLSAGSKFRH